MWSSPCSYSILLRPWPPYVQGRFRPQRIVCLAQRHLFFESMTTPIQQLCDPFWGCFHVVGITQHTRCHSGGVDAEADEKEMQQAALAAAAAAASTESAGASSAQGNKAVPVPRMKRSVEVLNAAAGQHLDAESATEKVAGKSAAQKLSEQIQEQQRLAGAADANKQEGNAIVQMPDDAVSEHGADDAVIDGQHVDHALPLHLPLLQQEQPVLPSLQNQDLPVSQAEVQQQTAAQAALTSLTK